MNTAVIVLCSIVIFFQLIFFGVIIWVAREDKKRKGKDVTEEEQFEKELWEIDTKIHELQATFKCKKNLLEYLNFDKEFKEQMKDLNKKEDKEILNNGKTNEL